MAGLKRFLDGVLVIVVAGLLWALASLPLVTVVPATAALYAVMIPWAENGLSTVKPVWSTYWSGFRRYAKQAFWFMLLLTIAWLVIVLDIRYGLNAEGAPLRPVVMVAGLVATLFLCGILVFLFPVMVRFPGPWRLVLRNAGLFAAAYVWTTVQGLLVMGFGVVLFLGTPWALPLVVSLAAFVLTRLTGRAFDRYLLTHGAPGQTRDSQPPPGSATTSEPIDQPKNGS